MNRRYAAIGVAVLALFGLAGCGDGENPTDDGTSPTQTTESGLTRPGSTLDLGETATVPRTDSTGVIELTITSIERGDSSDLRRIGYDNADQDTPYYVHFTMRLISGESQGITMRHHLSAWAGDTPASELVLSEPFSRCQERNFPLNAGAGTTVTSCRPYLTDKGALPVDTVRFDNDDAYDSFAGNSIDWM